MSSPAGRTVSDVHRDAGAERRAAALDADRDAEIIHRERALPALGLLLDDDELTARLRQAGWIGASERARVDRVRLKPGTSVQAAVQLEPRNRWLLVAGFTADSWPKAGKHERVARRAGTGALVCRDLLLVVTDMAADRALRPLRRLRPDRGPGLLPAAPPREGPRHGRRDRATRTIAYNPARRWVGTQHAAHGTGATFEVVQTPRSVIKVHSDRSTGARARDVAALVAATGITVPEVSCRPDGVVRMAWADGRAPDPEVPDDAAAVADVLSRLATAPVGEPGTPLLRRLDQGDLMQQVTAAVQALTVQRPEDGARAGALLARLDRNLAALTDDVVLVHGDFSSDQLVFGADGPVLLDLDRAGAGPAGWDAAGWLAAQVACGIRWDEAAELPGPAVPGPLLAAAALLRTPEPWRRRRPGRSGATRGLLDLAEAAMSGGRP